MGDELVIYFMSGMIIWLHKMSARNYIWTEFSRVGFRCKIRNKSTYLSRKAWFH